MFVDEEYRIFSLGRCPVVAFFHAAGEVDCHPRDDRIAVGHFPQQRLQGTACEILCHLAAALFVKVFLCGFHDYRCITAPRVGIMGRADKGFPECCLIGFGTGEILVCHGELVHGVAQIVQCCRQCGHFAAGRQFRILQDRLCVQFHLRSRQHCRLGGNGEFCLYRNGALIQHADLLGSSRFCHCRALQYGSGFFCGNISAAV